MSIQEYEPGDTVFAKLKGYPWWPARVENDKDIPPKVLNQKSKSKGLLYTVLFYGTKDYGFFGPDSIRPFDREEVEREAKTKKYRSKDLERAIHQALDPSLMDQEEEEEEEEKPKRNNIKKKPVPKKPRKAQENAKRLMTRKRLSVEIDMEDTKRYKGLSMEEEVKNGSEMSVETFKGTPEFKKVYRIRHKLQKLVYEKEPGDIPKEDYARIFDIVNEIKRLPMTLDLIKYTKIGRVLNCASNYGFDENEFNIQETCLQVLESWQSITGNYHC